MIENIRRSLLFAATCIVVLGFAYTFAGTGVAQLLFRYQANGSISANGSALIGQNWASTTCPGHPDGTCVFHGRPDDTGPYVASRARPGGDNPLVANGADGASGATNLGPRSKVLLAATRQLVGYWHRLGVRPTPDLVTTSGSGLDPDITPEDAEVQIPMVSAATGIERSALSALVKDETRGPELGFLGSRYIDVLQLDEALAKLR